MHKQVINQTASVVIPGEPGKVFHDHAVDFPAHHIGQKPLVEVPQQVTLVFRAVAVVFSFFQILFGKADILAQTPVPDHVGRG